MSVAADRDIHECTIDVSHRGAVTTIAVTGDLVWSTVSRLRPVLDSVEPRERVLLDLRHVRALDSAGTGMIIHAFTACRRQGTRMAVAGDQPDWISLFGSVGLTQFVPLLETESDIRAWTSDHPAAGR
jgi:anti-anti-sigma factor